MLVWSSSLCNFLYNLTSCYYDPITKGKNIWFLLRLCLNVCSSVTSDSHGGREHAVPPLNQTQQIWQIESSGVWRSRSKTSNVFSRGTWMQKCWQEHLDPFFVKLVDWMSSLCHSSVPAVAVNRISCTVAANICVLYVYIHIISIWACPSPSFCLSSTHECHSPQRATYCHTAPSSYSGDICSLKPLSTETSAPFSPSFNPSS